IEYPGPTPGKASRPRDTPRGGTRRCSSGGFFSGSPRPPGALLDVAPDEASHDLRGRRVLLGTKTFEETLLARVDEYRQSCGAVLKLHGYPLAGATVLVVLL